MILNATLKSNGKATTIPIPVGDGDHSFKWLALAASEHDRQRYDEANTLPRISCQRHISGQETSIPKAPAFSTPKHYSRIISWTETTLPWNFYSSNSPSLDEHHRLSLSKWSRIGDANADERDRLIEEKTAQLERERQRRERLLRLLRDLE